VLPDTKMGENIISPKKFIIYAKVATITNGTYYQNELRNV
jgi:hypothetical protein